MSDYKVGSPVAMHGFYVATERDAWGHGRGDLHEVEVYSNDSGHQTVFGSTIAPWPDAERMARLEAILGEIVDALDYDLSELRMVDPAIEIPEREARLALALRNARSLIRAGETAYPSRGQSSMPHASRD
jgi:hypothetical protein